MALPFERTAWALARERLLLKGKANFQPLVDSLNLGNGSGKRNRTNSKPLLYVSENKSN